jgi:ribosomal protein S18 acetylase RimI-like enzyme
MSITIRKATEADFSAILDLVKGLAIFQNSLERVTNTVEQMHKEKDLFNCFVAENENQEIVGIASYSFIYYTWVGKSLYLDDLYVKESCRGQKIGSELLKKIFEVAKAGNCKRVRWQVSEWNTNAITFYKKIGAEIDEECCNCDFDAKEIQVFSL